MLYDVFFSSIPIWIEKDISESVSPFGMGLSENLIWSRNDLGVLSMDLLGNILIVYRCL